MFSKSLLADSSAEDSQRAAWAGLLHRLRQGRVAEEELRKKENKIGLPRALRFARDALVKKLPKGACH